MLKSVDTNSGPTYNQTNRSHSFSGNNNPQLGINTLMTSASRLQNTNALTICELCGRRSRKGWSFAFKKPLTNNEKTPGMVIKCSKCAARHVPMLRRSLIVALLVGTVLTILNQGDAVFSGTWKTSLYWKIPLTYFVPFCVVTYGALSNGRR